MVAASLDGPEDTAQMQAVFPHLVLVSDPQRRLIDAAGVFLPKATSTPDTAAPTTILLDRGGVVRWIYRPPTYLKRLPPDDVLAAVDEHLPRAVQPAR